MIVNVLVPLALNEPFTYNSDFELIVGDLVEVPVGNKKLIGMVWDVNVDTNIGLKDVIKKIDITPINDKLKQFIK